MRDNSSQSQASARELVAFRTAEQDYCVDIMSVREIRGWTPTTSLPKSPGYVRGVINLRGSVVPIVDLAARIGLPSLPDSERNVIMIAVVQDQVVGLLVEAVFEILTIEKDAIQPTPEIASEQAKAFVQGVIADEDRMIRLIDLERILPSVEKDAA